MDCKNLRTAQNEIEEFYSKQWVTFLIIMFSELKWLKMFVFGCIPFWTNHKSAWILALKYFRCQEFTLLWWCTWIDESTFKLCQLFQYEKKIIKSGKNYFTFLFLFKNLNDSITLFSLQLYVYPVEGDIGHSIKSVHVIKKNASYPLELHIYNKIFPQT